MNKLIFISCAIFLILASSFVSGEYSSDDCADLSEKIYNQGEGRTFSSSNSDFTIAITDYNNTHMTANIDAYLFEGVKQNSIIHHDGKTFEIVEINEETQEFTVEYDEEEHVVNINNYEEGKLYLNPFTGEYRLDLKHEGGDEYTLYILNDLEYYHKEFVLGETFEFKDMNLMVVKKDYDPIEKKRVYFVLKSSDLAEYCYEDCNAHTCSIKPKPIESYVPPEKTEKNLDPVIKMFDNDFIECDNGNITMEYGVSTEGHNPGTHLELVGAGYVDGKFDAKYIQVTKKDGQVSVEPLTKFERRIKKDKELFSCNGEVIKVTDYNFEEGWLEIEIAQIVQEPEPIIKPEEPVIDPEPPVMDEPIVEPEENATNETEPEMPEPIIEVTPPEPEEKTFFQKIVDFFSNLF